MGDLYHRDVSKTVFQHGSGQPEASGAHVFAGLVILLVGAAIGSSVGSDAVTYVLVAIGIAAIISAFLMITRQYERAVILRLGKYNRQAGAGVQTRLPFVDSVLVVDIGEKVASSMQSTC